MRLRAAQVLLLLKSSDRVAHDICHAFDACAPGRDPQRLQQQVQHSLALRKWVPLQPEREFRCFVRRRELIGERSTRYPYPTCTFLSCPGCMHALALCDSVQ